MIDSQPDPAGDTATDLVDSAAIPINANMRLDSLELRTRNLEAQHVWLRLEQLEAQVRSMAKVLATLVDGDHNNSGSIDSGADARRRVQL